MNNAILKHITGLTRYRALRYFARLPTRTAESGSLTLCTAHFLLLPSDPAVTSNALAIRIVFPLVGVTPGFSRLGLPAMSGKQKKGGKIKFPTLFVSFLTCSMCRGFRYENRGQALSSFWRLRTPASLEDRAATSKGFKINPLQPFSII